MKKYNIAVVGATGNVGRETINILAERNFPVENLYALASSESLGKKISFGENKTLTVDSLDNFDFSNIDIVFSSAGSHISRKFVPDAVKSGAVVIDKTSLFRMDENVPLIVPEVNGHLIRKYKESGIIANPNCVAIPMCVALKPLDNAARIKRIVASTYQSTSGAGRSAMDELHDQTKSKFLLQQLQNDFFEKQIAFNLIPKIGDFEEDGYTDEEVKIACEIGKILGEHALTTVTSVRVPIFTGHSISMNVEFEKEITAEEAGEILFEADGVRMILQNSDTSYITPVEIVGEDEVFVMRLREDKTKPNTLNMWVTCDNLRKGAALNAVQIAEELICHLD
ncbi:MAG: aspartate-semialdehyde dehydrogenase [Rickettsiaceae bacterium]|nr:aspartate-semialdehyde dehydrogenase [Rickettsiaceae bacterium]